MKETCFAVLMSILLCSYLGHGDTVVSEHFLRGQEVMIDSGNRNMGPKHLFGDLLYAWDMNYHGGKLTKNEWRRVEHLLVADEHNELGLMVLSRDRNGDLFVLNRFWTGEKLHSLIKIPHADSIAAVMDKSKWESFDLKQVPENITMGNNFVFTSDSSILVAGMLKEATNHALFEINYRNQRISPLDYWPDAGPTDNWNKHLYYDKNCVLLGNDKGKFLYQNGWVPMAFIFSIDGIHTDILNELYPYTPTPTPPGKRLACCANNDRIYVLFRDSNYKGAKIDKYDENDPWIYGNKIEVFDWDGVKQQVIHIDNYGQNVMLSEDGKTLYLVSDYSENIPNTFIYSYDISSLEDNQMIDSVEMYRISRANAEKNLARYGWKVRSVKEGDRMVDFVLYDYDDKPHHLNEFLGRGKYTVLDFSAIGCGPCQKARPYLEKFYKRYKDRFEMITISYDQLSEWKKKPVGEVSWHEWNDHNLARDIIKKYDVKGFPTFIIIDSNGKILSKSLTLKNFSEALKRILPAGEVDKVMDFK